MSPTRRQHRRGANPLLVVLLVAVAVMGAYGTLYFRGDVEAKWLDDILGRNQVVQAADTMGVIVTARPLRAGQEVTRLDIWDNQQKAYRTVPQRISAVQANQDGPNPWILNPMEIVGRVMARPKGGQLAFTESDFLPRGTRPGPQSLVPEGQRYVAVSEKAVTGLGVLAFRDHFDLVEVRQATAKELTAGREALRRVGHERVSRELRQAIELGSLVFETPLVYDGLVVRPAEYEGEAQRGKEREVGLALHPDQVSPLLGAIARGETIQCLPRSERNGDQPQARSSELSLKDQYDALLLMERSVRIVEGDSTREETMAVGGRNGTN